MRLHVLCAIAVLSSPLALAQSTLLDDFESLTGWEAVHSHGDACTIHISDDRGKTGRAMMMDFAFLGHMGSVSAQKRFARDLPSDFQLVFDIRAEAPVNNFIIRIYDSLDNVWIVNRANFPFPRAWTRLSIKKWQLPYGWGPSGGGDLRRMDRLEFIIDVVNGGSGKVWLDNLAIEPSESALRQGVSPRMRASTIAAGKQPHLNTDGTLLTGWHSLATKGPEWVEVDFGRTQDIGGLVIQWDSADFARDFDVLSMKSGGTQPLHYPVTGARGGRSIIPLYDSDVRKIRILATSSSRGNGVGIRSLHVKGPEFSFSPNDLYRAVAAESPRGSFPKYFLGQQSYWTIIGAAEDRSEAMMNEQGMIEVDRLSFSLEPFLLVDGEFRTWADMSITQSLERDALPIPSVHWRYGDRARLNITPIAVGPAGKSILFVRYSLENTGPARLSGSLFVALRPFQVNPPWQTFTIVGGVSRIRHVHCGETIAVDGKVVIPLVRPQASGACTFDQGDVTDYLRRGTVPASSEVTDLREYASGALQYAVDLSPGGTMDVVLAVPFHEDRGRVVPAIGQDSARILFERHRAEVASAWEHRVGRVAITLPPEAQGIANCVASTLAYILINADSAALQPGSRSYERSWIRDGALISTALLQMGVSEPVRRYLEWYGTYQYPDGKIPCVVDDRGAEPIPEHDSHGQFVYAVMQYFRFTGDTAWLRAQWPRVTRTLQYIQSLRAGRKTDLYRNGSPTQRACFGLVPESISHEGYCPKPMHSYWDDFFILRGLKDAAAMAVILGDSSRAREYAAERDDFRTCLYASMRLLMRNRGVDYIPGCVEQAEFGGLSATVGITPGEELGFIPDTLVRSTFDRCYKEFVDRKNGTVRWDSYLPYEFRFVGTFVYLGQRQRAGEMLSWFMRDRRPLEWNGWGEVVWRDSSAPRCIGDMPHAWAGSDFIRSFRSMLVYERERDASLVIGAGIMESWLDGPDGTSVLNLPTYFGKISYRIRRTGNAVEADITGDANAPEGGFVLKSPLPAPLKLVKSDRPSRVNGDEVAFTQLPIRIRLEY
jgi:hypothetical protein